LVRGASGALGRSLTDREVSAFGTYLALLMKWQAVHRLVGRADPRWIAEELFLNSLAFVRALPERAVDLLDLGSGAGIPGIPLCIVRRHRTMVLVESRRRRASFLLAAIRALGLEGVRVVNARAEDAAGELRGTCDAVVMRCAGRFDEMLPTAASFVRVGGVVVASAPEDQAATPGVELIDVGDVASIRRRFVLARV
jgi:16S rRNA (guanine527-N7)-methyltransferase